MFDQARISDYDDENWDDDQPTGLDAGNDFDDALFGSPGLTPTAELEAEIDTNGRRDERSLQRTALSPSDFEDEPETPGRDILGRSPSSQRLPADERDGLAAGAEADVAFQRSEEERYELESGESIRSDPDGLFDVSLDEDLAAARDQDALDPSPSSRGRVASVSFVRSATSGQMASTDTEPIGFPPGERSRRSGTFVPSDDNRLPPGVGRDPLTGKIVSKR